MSHNLKPALAQGERIKEERERIGIKQIELLRALDVSKTAIFNWESGATATPADKLEIMYQLGMDVFYIVTGVRMKSPDDIEGDYVYIPVYDVEVSAGHGTSGIDSAPVRYHAFRKRWLNFHGYKAKDLIVIKIKGDSMYPDLKNGEHVVVNTAKKTPKTGQIFVVRNHTELLAKYVETQLNGDIVLKSRNSFYSDIVISQNELMNDAIEIIGQAVHGSRDLD